MPAATPTPRPEHRVEGEATEVRARTEGVIGKERDCVCSVHVELVLSPAYYEPLVVCPRENPALHL
jgi:hypothetical protein